MSFQSSLGYRALILGPAAFVDLFANACFEVYSGAQPPSANSAATGTLLARITRDGGAFVAGNPLHGCNFSQSAGTIMKRPGERWFMVGLATGTAGWWRLRANGVDSGANSLVLPRIDGKVGLFDDAEADFQLPSLAITGATNREINNFTYTP